MRKHKKILVVLFIYFLAAGALGVSASAPVADRLRSHAVQDFAPMASDWEQVNLSGFGDLQTDEVPALEAFNGYLYAGTHNPIDPPPGPMYDGAQIWRASDGVTWDAVTLPGFGISHDIAPPAILDMIVFNTRLYASTGRGDGPAQIWRSLNGTTWAPMVIDGFADPDNADITALAVYNSYIYAGVSNLVSGAQIWRSFSGDSGSWTQVAPTQPGSDVASITGFAPFNGGLYAAVESNAPAQLWFYSGGDWSVVMSDGFGDANTTSLGGLAVFAGELYVGAGNSVQGAQLWRTSNGVDWTQTIPPAFGDANNQKVELVFVHQNQLYASVKNTSTGLEVWRSPDGSAWEQANLDGFDGSHNTASNWSNATADYLSQLYVGTLNITDGGEIWRMMVQPELQADLSLTKADVLDPVFVGDNITYTLTVSNAGPDSAQNVVLSDTLPGSLVFISATPGQGTCNEAEGTVSCNLGSIPSANSTGVEIVVNTTAPALLTNNASLTSDTTDPNPANNADSETTTVDPLSVPHADLGLTKADALDPVTVGNDITYVLTVTNTGPDSAQNVVLGDTLPGSLVFVSATPGQGSCNQAGGVVTCSLGVLPSAGSTVVEIIVTTTAEGTLTNSASVAADTADPNPNNNSDNETTTITPGEPLPGSDIFLPVILKSGG